MMMFRRIVQTAAAVTAYLVPVVVAAQDGTPPSLGAIVGSFYDYALSLVGLAVFAMFLYAGIKMLLGDRAGAKKLILDAIIGALLLFSAYIILNTINPDLVKFDQMDIPSLRKSPTTNAPGSGGTSTRTITSTSGSSWTFASPGASCGTSLPCYPGYVCKNAVCTWAGQDEIAPHAYCSGDFQCAGDARCVTLYEARAQPGLVKKCCAPGEITTSGAFGGGTEYCTQ